MTTAVDRVCQQCGHHFSTQAWKGKQGKGKFCSVACHNAFQTGKPSLISSEKLSAAQKASYKENPERAINNSAIMKRLWATPGFRARVLKARGTPEAKRKQAEVNSQVAKRMWQNPDIRTKILESRKQTVQSPEFKKRISISSTKRWQDPEYKARLSKIHKELCQNPEFIKIMSEAQSKAGIKRWQNPEYRKRQMEAQKRSWEDPEIVAKRFAGFNKKPNKPEQRLIDILAKHLPQFQYNKEVIEVLGDYFHSPDVVRNRWQGSELGKILLYNSLGYKCLIIWEHELKELEEEAVVAEVNNFFS